MTTVFQTPILFITFNRLDTARQVFAVIRQIRPKYLYLASDGPRAGHEGEKNKIEAVRRYILDNIDWDCQFKVLFRVENLGSGKAVAEAISWFFEQAEQGIILEHDCLPSLSFFTYCAELLEKYKNDDRIYHISGSDPLLKKKETKNASYYFSRSPMIWGWATWRRAWRKYNFVIQDFVAFVAQKKLAGIFRRHCDQQRWLDVFCRTVKYKVNTTWDYQWVYTIWQNDGIVINPTLNLVSNIGFGAEAVHTADLDSVFNNQPRYELRFIRHPAEIKIAWRTDAKIQQNCYGVYSFWGGVFRLPIKIKKFFLLLAQKGPNAVWQYVCQAYLPQPA
jgi:hypothetical protein